MVDIIIHHNRRVQHNPGLTYIGGFTDEIKNYDTDFLSMWEIEDVVRDLGYVNDLHYWYMLDDNDIDELGKPLTNDNQVVDFLNIIEVYECSSVHIYIEYRVDVAIIVAEVPQLPPLEGVDDNGHENDHAEGGVEGNVEGDVGQAERDVGTKPSKKKGKKKVVSSKKVTKSKGAKPSNKKNKGPATARRGGRVSTRIGSGEGCGVPDVVHEEDLQLSDFEVTDEDDEDLYITNVPLTNEYMENWWGKFAGAGHYEDIVDEGEKYYDSEELVSLAGSGDEGTSRRVRRCWVFNESHDMRVPIELEKCMLFTDFSVTKMVCYARRV
jgi:hypothetical protein